MDSASEASTPASFFDVGNEQGSTAPGMPAFYEHRTIHMSRTNGA
jgi:hypothetical protein